MADFYTSVANNEFDDDIVNFLAKEVEKASERKKEANERRKIKKKEEKERKLKEARERTIVAAQPLVSDQISQVLQAL